MKKLLFFFTTVMMMFSCSKDSVQDSLNNESFDVSYQLGVNPFFENPTSIGFDFNEVLNMISYNKQESTVEFDDLFDVTSSSLGAREFIEDFFESMMTFSNFPEFKDYLILQEEYLIDNESNFSYGEWESLLRMTSVARHSGYLWYYEEDVENHSGFWTWVAAADILGGIAGALKTHDAKGFLTGAVTLSAAVVAVGLII